MKIMKKIICLLLVAAMVLAFASCENKPNVTTGESKSTVKPADSTSGDVAEKDYDMDLGGRHIKRMYWWQEAEPDPNTSEANEKWYKYNQGIYNTYNFTVDYVEGDWDTYVSDIVSSVLASQDGKDLICDITDLCPRWLYPGLISSNYLYAWNDSKWLKADDPMWSAAVTKAATYQGKVYGSWLMPFYARDVIFWNVTMFDKLGLESLYTLMENKQWTWDKFEEYCTKLNQDTDGDSVPDVYAFGGEGWDSQFILNNGGKTITFDDEGMPVYAMDDAATIEALQFVTDMKLANYFATSTSTQWDWYTTDFANSKIGMLGFGWYQSKTFVGDEETPATMTDKFGYTAAPLGNSNLNGDYKWSVLDFNVTSILAKTYQPEDVAFAFYILSKGQNEIDTQYWDEKYESEVGDKDALAWAKKIFFEDVVAIDYLYIYQTTNDGWYEYNGRFTTDGVAAVIEEVKAAQQAGLDDVFKKDAQ